MRRLAQSVAKRFLNENALDTVRQLRQIRRVFGKQRTRRLISSSGDTPAFLPPEKLEPLQSHYRIPPEYGYDPGTVSLRGERRCAQLMSLHGFRSARSVLEIGCLDGMVSCMLTRSGKEATAIDIRGNDFDQRAVAAGVNFKEMDACDLKFDDKSFDALFSYDTFEHVADPELMLSECVRVVKKGGVIYLNFGPLYMSPYGEHAYRSIPLPYCHHLFTHSDLNAFAAARQREIIDQAHVNRWSVRQYRELWKSRASVLEPLLYRELTDFSHVDLIRRFPSCFCSKSRSLDEFTVAGIRVLFRRVR